MKIVIYSPSSSSKPVWISLFCRTQMKIFWRKFVTRLFWGTIDFHSRRKNTMEVNGAPELLWFLHSSEYLPLCSAEQTHSYRFGTTWGWVNDDRIFIFGWTIPLIASLIVSVKGVICRIQKPLLLAAPVAIKWTAVSNIFAHARSCTFNAQETERDLVTCLQSAFLFFA